MRFFEPAPIPFAGVIFSVFVIAILLMASSSNAHYPQDTKWLEYKGRIAFTYPANWALNNCIDNKPFLELPGKLNGDFRTHDQRLKIYGSGSDLCRSDVSVKLNIGHPQDASQPCKKPAGELLQNGLYLNLVDDTDYPGYIWLVVVSPGCDEVNVPDVLSFSFEDPQVSSSGKNILMYGGEPRVNKEQFQASPQYRDMKRMAESIRPVE